MLRRCERGARREGRMAKSLVKCFGVDLKRRSLALGIIWSERLGRERTSSRASASSGHVPLLSTPHCNVVEGPRSPALKDLMPKCESSTMSE